MKLRELRDLLNKLTDEQLDQEAVTIQPKCYGNYCEHVREVSELVVRVRKDGQEVLIIL